MDILIEIFPTFVDNSEINDLVIFYIINKPYQQLLSSNYILNIINIKTLLNFYNIQEVMNYYKLGIPSYQNLLINNFKEQSPTQINQQSYMMKFIYFNNTGTIKATKQKKFLDVIMYFNADKHYITLYMNYDYNIQYYTTNVCLQTFNLNNYMFYFKIKYRAPIAKQVQWLKDKVWLLLEDKTLPEAIQIVTELGYEDFI